jgi:hypothetical protein
LTRRNVDGSCSIGGGVGSIFVDIFALNNFGADVENAKCSREAAGFSKRANSKRLSGIAGAAKLDVAK